LLRGWQGDATIGLERLRRALDEAGERDDAAAQVRTLGWLGWVMWVNGITEQAAWLAGQMEGHAADTEAWDSAYAFLSLGSLLYEAGLDADATQALERALSYFKEAGEKHGAIFAAAKLGLLNQKSGEIEPARSRFFQALEAARQLNDVHVIAYSVDDACLFLSAQQHTSAGEKVEVVRILGAVDHWREILSLLRTPREKQAYNRLVTDLTGSLGESAFHQARQVGQALTAEEVIQRTLTLVKTSSNAKAKNESLGKVEGMNVSLSEREQQVIRLVAEGYSNQEIADRLYITERTVRFHVNSIFNKLGADNRTQAVNIVNRLGLLN
jgi:DNA-binding CsgD family transcriptional regulator